MKRWYRSLTPEGKLWCESSDPDEVARMTPRGEGYTFWVCEAQVVYSPWERVGEWHLEANQ